MRPSRRCCYLPAFAASTIAADVAPQCTVAQVSLIIYGGPASLPLERFVFNTAAFPIVGPKEHLVPFSLPDQLLAAPANAMAASATASSTTAAIKEAPHPAQPPPLKPRPTPMIDLTTQLAAVLGRLQTTAPTLEPLPGTPAQRSFTLAIETRERRDGGKPPLGQSTPWMPARPGLQKLAAVDQAVAAEGGIYQVPARESVKDSFGPTDQMNVPLEQQGEVEASEPKRSDEDKEREGNTADWKGPRELTWVEVQGRASAARSTALRERGRFRGGVRTTPVRLVEAGPFVMEVWVEETHAKAEAITMGGGADSNGSGSAETSSGTKVQPPGPSPIPPKPPRYPEPSRHASVEDEGED